MTVADDKKKVLLQREQIENFRLLGEAIKIWLGDFKNLVLTILLVISVISNGGNILLNAMSDDNIGIQYKQFEPTMNIGHKIKRIENIVNTEIKIEDIELNEIENNVIGIKNILGFVITLLLTVVLFIKKREGKKNASTDTTTN
jgi:hypothetical protein